MFVKQFYHMSITSLLQSGIPEKNLCALQQDRAQYIKNGMCYALVMDWFINMQNAESYYWEPGKAPKPHIDYIRATMDKARFDYYKQIANCHYQYCIGLKPYFDNNKISIDIQLSDGTIKKEDVLREDIVYQMSNVCAKNWRAKWKFNAFGSFVYPQQEDVKVFMIDLNKRHKRPYKMLIHMFLHSCEPNSNEKLFRHSIGIQKLISSDGMVLFRFFDPSIGVYLESGIGTFYKALIARLYTNKTLVYLQYFIAE